MFIIWDLLVVAVVAFCALMAYHKGFLNAVVRLVGTVGALALSLVYSAPAARLVYENFFEQRVLNAVTENIGRFGEPGTEAFAEGMKALVESLPPVFAQAIQSDTSGMFEEWYGKALTSGAETLSASLAESVIGPIAVGLLQAVAFCLLFGVSMLLVNLLAGMLRGVNKIPLVGTVNALLGGVFGAAQGMLYVFVGAAVLWLVMTAAGGSLPWLSAETVEQTFLFKYFFLAGPWADNALKLV